MYILEVRIDNLSKKEILEKIEFFLSENKFHQIATVNPEYILCAQKDSKFQNILNECDLNIADGIGLKYSFWRYGRHLRFRFAGVDMMHEILQVANKKKLSVFLACSSRGLSIFEENKNALSRIYPSVHFGGDNIDPRDFTLYKMQNTKYDILFCNFGAPFQEYFINQVRNDRIKLAMGVGGSFDFMVGKIARAPKLLRFLGLEWIWRFMLEPKYRALRIFRAVILFPYKVVSSASKNANQK